MNEKLAGAVIGLAKACMTNPVTENTMPIIREALKTLAAGSDEAEAFEACIQKLHDEKYAVSPGCATCTAHCGATDDYDFDMYEDEPDTVKELKVKILRTVSENAEVLGDNDILEFLRSISYYCEEDYFSDKLKELDAIIKKSE